MLPVASTRNSRFPAEYSANWIDIVSVATCVGVALAGMEVAVRVAVGGSVEVGVAIIGVADGPVAVGKACVAVSVGVRVGVGVERRRITNERTVDHAPLVPLAVRPRTRHQNVRSLVNVCDVWVCVSPVRERTSGELNELESSIWIW